jgi:hypothetical protein
MESYVSDGVLLLRKKELDGRQFRELEIAKMRGTAIRRHKCIFTLDRGFRVIEPFNTAVPSVSIGEEEGQNESFFSQFPVEERVVMELGFEVQPIVSLLVAMPLFARALSEGKKVLIIPSPRSDSAHISEALDQVIGERMLRANITLACPENSTRTREEWIYPLRKGLSDLAPLLSQWRISGQRYVVFSDLVSASPSLGEEGLELLLNDNNIGIPDLDLRVTPLTGLRAVSSTREGNICRIRQIDGSVVIFGVKPYTPLYGVELHREGMVSPRFIPIV